MTPETAVAQNAHRLLVDMGFDVYQEVPLGNRADLVGVRGKLVCVVECKTSLTIDVIAQAEHWRPYAHYRYVAVPRSRSNRALAREILLERGIGLIEEEVTTFAPLNRHARPEKLLAVLRPEHKTYAAAGSQGSYWSPWRDSVARIKRMVQQRPGIELKELVQLVPHHWASAASAKSSIARQIACGVISGLRLETVAKSTRVYEKITT